jgi:hypothetical protein
LTKELNNAFEGKSEKNYDLVMDEDSGRFVKVAKRVQKKPKTGKPIKKNSLGVGGRQALEPILEECVDATGLEIVP